MADKEKSETSKRKVNRQKGGYALVEVVDVEGTQRLDILVHNLDGQKEATDALTELIDTDEVKGDGERTFGIIQVKRLDLCPKVTRKVSF